MLRGGGELADATAGARTAARPEAGRIARVRERLRSGLEPPGVESAPATVRAEACPDGGVRCRVGPIRRMQVREWHRR